jgi:hypothetical protein
LAKATGHSEWENLRPPMQPMATDKLDALIDSLVKDFDMHF